MKQAFLIVSIFCNTLLCAHGFGDNTPVHLADGSRMAIEQLCHRIEKSRVYVASSNLRRNTVERKWTRLYGYSTSNCYLRLSFCDTCNGGDVICTPYQPFYVVKSQEVVTVGEKAGSKAKPKVEEHPHGIHKSNAGKHHENSWREISKGPTNGQEALDTSVAVEGRDCRVSVNNGEIVVLELTSPGVYHGYVVSWADIVRASKNGKWQDVQNTLVDSRLVKRNGKIVK